MKVNLFVKVVLAVIAICLVSISLAVWTQTLTGKYITTVDNISYIPKEWGNLKSVAVDQYGNQSLYFETSDGTIYIVRGHVYYDERWGCRFMPEGAAKILRESVSVQPEKKEAPGTGF